LLLIFGGMAVAAVVAGVITAFVIASRGSDAAPSPELLATVEAGAKTTNARLTAQAGTATAERATESATYKVKLGTPIPVDSLQPVTLMFCEPLREPGGGTQVAVIGYEAQVVYRPGGCQPDIDASGAITVRNKDGSIGRVTPTYLAKRDIFSPDNFVWTPAKGTLNGTQVVMTGRYLQQNAQVEFDPLEEPIVTFQMTDDGQQVFGSLSERLIGYPIATFLDGVPVRGTHGQILAPTIQAKITSDGQFTGLPLDAAKRLAAIIANGLAR